MFYKQDLSIFLPGILSHPSHRALTLQFVLSELFKAHEAFESNAPWDQILSAHTVAFPYDLGKSIGHLNKLWDHSLHLKKSFFQLTPKLKRFEKALFCLLVSWNSHQKVEKSIFYKGIKRLYSLLEPFIKICKEDENLFLFLLKNKQTVDQICSSNYLQLLFEGFYPEGRVSLEKKMCDRYHERGFFSQISEIKTLLSNLK